MRVLSIKSLERLGWNTVNGNCEIRFFRKIASAGDAVQRQVEVWNPGRLPKGKTVEKLNGEHTSFPVNPLLANPVYLAGYIEQVGTGTNDVIDRCLELGLRKPEFRQDEDYMVTLWRREVSHQAMVM